MAISMVREPSAYYNARQGASYYAEDDVNLTTSLGTLSSDTSAILINLVYGKIILNNTIYLVSINDMEMTSDMKNYNSITNIDDIIPFRYAYGDQNGYVIGKGQELSYTINGRDFRVNSGRVVLNGVESDVDANGVTFTIDNASETRYYVVYYQVNLATNTTDILLSNFSTTGYPVIDIGDDLTTNPSGLARMELYRFQTNGGVIENVEKIVKAIEYSGTALVGYDISKGTVEERLNALGFREGSAILGSNVVATRNILKRQGNYVLAEFTVRLKDFNDRANTYLELPSTFEIENSSVSVAYFYFGRYNSSLFRQEMWVGTWFNSGSNRIQYNIPMVKDSGISQSTEISFSFGYEAKPL